jgi:hypothetical protein
VTTLAVADSIGRRNRPKIVHLISASNASAGVFQFNDFRGRLFNAKATASKASAPCALRSVPFGKY